MMLARMIFRLDFRKVCTKYVNEPGTAISILESSEDKFWDELAENPQKRVLTAKFHAKNSLYREINFDPSNINGSIEFLIGGTALEDLLKNSTFAELDRLSNEYLKIFDVSELRRAGIRFFLLENVPVAEGGMLGRFCSYFPDNIKDRAFAELGDITDTSVLFEGQGEDEILYRVQFGPHFKADSEKLLFPKGVMDNPSLFADEGFNLLCDIDLYENELSFREFTLASWSKTKVAKAAAFMQALSAGLTQ